jgi:hypothetical protein
MEEQEVITEEFRRKFQHILDYKETKGGQLTEEFVRADLSVLKNAMIEDETLRQFLNLKATELVEKFPQYGYLVDEIGVENEATTLLNVIEDTLRYRKFKSFFSKSGSKITGFVAYVSNGREVSDIKMFSFDPSRGGGTGLVIDLRRLLNDLVKDPNIIRISWSAMKDNPFNEAYQMAIGIYKGNSDENGEMVNYWIDKTQNQQLNNNENS